MSAVFAVIRANAEGAGGNRFSDLPGARAGIRRPGLVPWWISQWRFAPPFLGLAVLRLAGGILLALGIASVLECFARFALRGIGTPAPVFPTRHLVVTGLYRHVRNPMYIAVVSMIFGQALLFGDLELLEYGALVWLLFHLFVLIYEEPTLRSTFGAEYESFRAKVPRWIPDFKNSR
jgi:protein-S-isoprenylcysteine O-methyltransferase Ste14